MGKLKLNYQVKENGWNHDVCTDSVQECPAVDARDISCQPRIAKTNKDIYAARDLWIRTFLSSFICFLVHAKKKSAACNMRPELCVSDSKAVVDGIGFPCVS